MKNKKKIALWSMVGAALIAASALWAAAGFEFPGDIWVNDAGGPIIKNTTSNPNISPNRAQATDGLGWDSGVAGPAIYESGQAVIRAIVGVVHFGIDSQTTDIRLHDSGGVSFLEDDANGLNSNTFRGPASLSASRTCLLEDDLDFVPDSCVGDGVDDDDPESINLEAANMATNIADDEVPVGGSANNLVYKAVPDCDATSQKLQYDTSTNTWSCGTDLTGAFNGVSIFSGGVTTATSASATRYFSISGNQPPATTENDALLTLPPSTPSSIRCRSEQVLTGSQTYTFMLRANLADTDWTCVVNSSTNPCTDSSGSALSTPTVTEHTWRVVPANTPTASRVHCIIFF
jgi:hypothetical protein